ncbi:MAG: SRPBCC family protein [Actinomycetota bacterium]|nr:SRPBCC family protein [Actinomycetota bacterium]
MWALLADAGSWTEWAGFDEVEVVEGRGEGEMRRLRHGKVESEERITAFEPPHRFAYEFTGNIPMRNYRSEVTLTPADDGGTEIRWYSTFNPKYPGTGRIIRRRLELFIAETADKLARAAE